MSSLMSEPHAPPHASDRTETGGRNRIEPIPSRFSLRTPPLRIAIVIERFVQDGGGVENVAWHVAHELARVGDEVTIVTRHPTKRDAAAADTAQAAAAKAGITIESLRVPGRWQPLRVVAFSRAAAQFVGRSRFDVVHSFSRTRHQDLFRAGGGSHADYLHHTHARLPAALRQLSPRHRVLLSIEGRVFRDPKQRIQCASKLVADALTERHGVALERILLLPNGVEVERFDSARAAEKGPALRRRLDEKADRIWLFPASGWRRKGLATLLEAMAQRPDPSLHLWIAGRDDPDPWRRSIAALGLSDRVRFLGSRDDLEVVYHAVDGMVLPTRYDAFANVTLEAAAAGLPIITTRTNGAAEWLEQDVWLLDDSSHPTAIAEALDHFSSATTRGELGQRARERARRFGWAQHVERLRDEYRRIVAARDERERR